MQRIEFGKWTVLSDPDLTREAYALIEDGGAECCGCESCFNFAATRHLVYPTELLDFFEWLGVDPQLDRGIDELLARLEERGPRTLELPPPPDRSR